MSCSTSPGLTRTGISAAASPGSVRSMLMTQPRLLRLHKSGSAAARRERFGGDGQEVLRVPLRGEPLPGPRRGVAAERAGVVSVGCEELNLLREVVDVASLVEVAVPAVGDQLLGATGPGAHHRASALHRLHDDPRE